MNDMKNTLYYFFVHDAKLGERWLLVIGVLSALAFRHYPFESTPDIPKNDEASFILRLPDTQDSLRFIVESLIGVPYQYAGKTPAGFDCSGFTRYVYQQLDVPLAASSQQQFREGIPIPLEDALPGDLVFFRSSEKISHVGVITRCEDQATFFVHASSSRGVVQDRLELEYFRTRLAGVRRILGNAN